MHLSFKQVLIPKNVSETLVNPAVRSSEVCVLTQMSDKLEILDFKLLFAVYSWSLSYSCSLKLALTSLRENMISGADLPD